VKLEVYADAGAAARAAAGIIAVEARSAAAARGRFVMAVSGGRTSWLMLRALAAEDVPWARAHVAQVDERLAPRGHPDRHLDALHEHLLDHTPMRAAQIAVMPVESSDPIAAAARYARVLADLAGSPPVLDLVHLALGADGRTASLIPDDPVLDVTDRDVAVTGIHEGRRRMTLTYPILDRARNFLWLVSGSDKTAMLARLRDGDRSIPAARVRAAHALAVSDRMTAGEPGPRY